MKLRGKLVIYGIDIDYGNLQIFKNWWSWTVENIFVFVENRNI